MKKYSTILTGSLLIGAVVLFATSCEKDYKKPTTTTTTTPTTVVPSASFVEEFDTVNNLPAKGWVFKNNSNPIGATGWRQGRYEPSNMAQNKKFLAPVPFVGFPAYSANNTPNDFVSCDISAATDANTGSANYSAWLISPQLPMKNGDQIIFYTRALDDSQYPVYVKDRMQVRANYIDGSTNAGSDTLTGSFTTLLLDINPNYNENDPGAGTGGGYPRTWTKVTVTLSGVPNGSVTNGRFAFRYFAKDAGLYGGTSQGNYPSVVGIDSLAFIHN